MRYGPLAWVFCLFVLAPQAVSAQTADYFEDEFRIGRLLDWGDRPVWSPDGARIAFTRSDSGGSPAYEMDLASRAVRCLTCRFGANGRVLRIYYLPDGSFLILGAAGLETAAANAPDADGARDGAAQGLYWMPASADMPPQALDAEAFGEVAMNHPALDNGGFRIAWGATGSRQRLYVGDLFHNGTRATLANRRLHYSYPPAGETAATMAEAYDFLDGGSAVSFFTIESGGPTTGMYRVDLESGEVAEMPGDGSHSEVHVFPDQRFAIEESNRAYDPDGPIRGISTLPPRTVRMILANLGWEDADEQAAKHEGLGFDLFLRSMADGRIRRLTHVGDIGGEAHQASPSPDGRRIVFAIVPPETGSYAGKPGLYLGTFETRR